MKKRIIILLLLLAVFIGGGLIWFSEATSPVDSQNQQSRIFIIEQGETIRSIAARLKKEGFIRDPLAFFILVKRRGIEMSIQAGDFRLRPSMSSLEVIDQLQHGTLDSWVTVLEGWRIEEIALKLAQELSIPEAEFIKYAKEGYMFPDTYLFPKEASASAVVKIMNDNFDKKVLEKYKGINQKDGLSMDQVIILASIVEREGRTDEDRPVIAGILLNRVREGWPLQADATLQYALGYQNDEKKWWKANLMLEDKEINSPFNTYMHIGLPPKPIASPGLSSIDAVMSSEVTDYWYYLHDPEGGVHYAKTFEEHQKNIDKYLR